MAQDTAKEFKRQFLHRDNERFELILADYNNVLEAYNNIFPKIEKTLGKSLTDADRLAISKDGFSAVLNLVRPLFQFPNADDSFNLQAIGLNLSGIELEMSHLHSIGFDYTITNGKLHLTEQETENALESVTAYTKNEAQNKALSIAKELIKVLKSAEDAGLLFYAHKQFIDRAIPTVSRELGQTDFAPNRHYILMIQENDLSS